MFGLKNLDAYFEKYKSIDTVFDTYRFVEPLTHKVYDYKDGKLIENGKYCYDIWGKGVPCKNCISRHVCDEKKKHFKLEAVGNKIFLVMSTPVEIEGKYYAMEFGKEITNSFLITNDDLGEKCEVSNVISKMNELVSFDNFTGLYNKRYLFEEIESIIKERYLRNITLTCVLFDIDKFKKINDKYGHVIGDDVIQRISEVLKSYQINNRLLCGRLGGDEFIIAFKNYETSDIKSITEEIIGKIETLKFDADGKIFNVNVSYGTALLTENDNERTFLERLDKAMYSHKKFKSHYRI